MTNNHISLFCLVDGEATSNAFPVKIESTKTIGELKDAIKAKKTNDFSDVDADKLTLWRVSIPDDEHDEIPVFLDSVPVTKKLRATSKLSVVFAAELPENTIHVIVQRPTSDPQYLPQKKKIRIEENWRPFTASDGTPVDLPPSWIDILANPEFVPEPRAAFAHLKNDLRTGDAIIVPSMGQVPKEFGSHGRGQTLFVSEQMLELWEEMRGNQELTYRRVLSGPMGVGKSYLSYFLAAKAYAEGWLVLYISDAKVLDMNKQDEAALEVVTRFLAMNKDILTGAEFEMLVRNYNGTDDISTRAVSAIFRELLKSQDRKTLLLVDEHGKLFEKEPYVPDKFKSLVPLSSFNWWDEHNIGTRLIFTGTAHANYEMKILEDSYRHRSDSFIGARITLMEFITTFYADPPRKLSWSCSRSFHSLKTPKNDFLTAASTERNLRWHYVSNSSAPSIQLSSTQQISTAGTRILLHSIFPLRVGQASLGSGHEKVLTCGYEGHPRFDFILGPLFIQVYISDFGKHNKDSAELSKAFNVRDSGNTNQIERYLNDMFGPGHSARIERGKFVVTQIKGPGLEPVPVLGFHIVYIRGSPGKPEHRELVKTFPDVLHISFEELKEKLFKNIV
ncbi:hypothetical protein BGZ95_000771 [Linnemannia exigua]|uniref:Crinkler effector protein N-terminal domain-containing protein n=1 Tax=Linnemannia exigua TaxID=604196 RepID=A0AAD4D7R8_9FUNG|nr:hypothetical protein BGZ95_000771 [Linnemannia exigua]